MLNTLRMKPTLKILNVYSRAPPASKLLVTVAPTTAAHPSSTIQTHQSAILTKLLLASTSPDNTTLPAASEPSTLKANGEAIEFFASFKPSSPTVVSWSSTTSSLAAESDPVVVVAEESQHPPYYEYDDTLDILMPLFVGLLVAIILGWMLMRYKMSAHQRSNYNGSIYCCPEECFNFCSRFLECQFRNPNRAKNNNRRVMKSGFMAPSDYSNNPHELFGFNSNGSKRSGKNHDGASPQTSRLLGMDGESNGGIIAAGLKMSLATALPTASAYEKSLAAAAAAASSSKHSKSLKFQQAPLARSQGSTRSSLIMSSPDSSRSSSFRIPQIITTSEPPNNSASTDLDDLPGLFKVLDETKLHSLKAISEASSSKSSSSMMSNESTVGPMVPMVPFRFLQRDSLASSSSSRRNSNAPLPDLMRSSNFGNLYHSFQSRNSTFVG